MVISKNLRKTLSILPIAGTILFASITANAELGDSILKKDTEHEDVKILQERLIDLNFLNIEETTTYYDDITVQAVKDFQNFYGLRDDGAFGPDTFEVLDHVSKIIPLTYERTLRQDMEGQDVKALQERLQIMGFLDIDDIDSTYGSKTGQAVLNFQELYQLPADGVAGSDTIDAINKALHGNRRMKRPLPSRGGLNGRHGDIISTAKQYIGTPYRYGGTSSSGFDCAGFVQVVYKSHGISVPRSSAQQANAGTKLNKDQLQTGDLLIFSNTYKSGPSHTGIYIGDGQFIHSSSSKGVTVSDLSDTYYTNHFSYGRRVY